MDKKERRKEFLRDLLLGFVIAPPLVAFIVYLIMLAANNWHP